MKSGQYETDDYKLKGIEVRLKVKEGTSLYSTEPITSQEDAVRVMAEAMAELDREYVCVVNLDNRCRPINYNVVSIGTINQCPVAVSNIFKSAILSNAGSIIMLHSHPSGDVTPSKEDFLITKGLVEAGKIMNIPVVDHIIIGGGTGKRFSFRNETDMIKSSDMTATREPTEQYKNLEKEQVNESGADASDFFYAKRKGDMKMSFDEFRDEVKEALAQRIQNTEIKDVMVNKLQGESYRGITLKGNDSMIGVNISLEPLYENYKNGKTVEEIADHLEESFRGAMKEKPFSVNINDMRDYSVMKHLLTIQIVNAQENAEMLKNVPHKMMEDLAEVCKFDVSEKNDSEATILVTDNLLNNYGIGKQQLFADAEQSAPILHPVQMKPLGSVIGEITGNDMPDDEIGIPIIVASNEKNLLGAGVMAYPDFMEKAAEKIGGDFYVLPSSIHEVLLLKDDGTQEAAMLEDMVRSVNETTVDKAEQLSDNVYHYDSKEKIFEFAEKFEKRQEKKEKEAAEKKGSVLDALGEKRKETFKAEPKLAEPTRKYKGEANVRWKRCARS